MNAIKDEIRINAGATKAHEALTRQVAYRGWWNAKAEISESVGSDAKLYFVKDGQPINMRFRIDEVKANESVRWTCTAHDMPTWVGTTLNWRINEAGGAAVVSLDHSGWKDAAPGPVAEGWKHFRGSLKAYLETGTGQPW
jgi:hypothetical protein